MSLGQCDCRWHASFRVLSPWAASHQHGWDHLWTQSCTLLLSFTVGTCYYHFPQIQLVTGRHVRFQHVDHPFNSLLPLLLDIYVISNLP